MSIKKDDPILITGGFGFIGNVLYNVLVAHDYEYVAQVGGKRQGIDLGEEANVGWLFDKYKPSIIINLASKRGGIGANNKYPGGLMYENLNMGIRILEEARQYDYKKFIMMGDISCYPHTCEAPFKEKDFWNGYPNISTGPYSVAKKTLLELSNAYAYQFDKTNVNLVSSEVYGPGMDFDARTSQFIPACLTKLRHSKENNIEEITLWGDPEVKRGFLYIDDCALAIMAAMENRDSSSLLNIGGVPFTLREIVEISANLIGYEGNIVWEKQETLEKGDRYLDVSKAEKELGFKVNYDIEYGIQKTIEYMYATQYPPLMIPYEDLPPSHLG